MTSPATIVPTAATAPRAIGLEDVYRVVGALTLEVELLRKENAQLRAVLAERGPSDGDGSAR